MEPSHSSESEPRTGVEIDPPDPVEPHGPFELSGNLEFLIDLAEASIVGELTGRPFESPPLDSLPHPLRQPGDIFVTVKVGGELNGCIGTLDEPEPLAHSVVRLARSAAFSDPRLPALRAEQLPFTEIGVSLLSRPTSIPVESWRELVAAVHPGVDGVILEAGHNRGLFLPVVWKQLPDPVEFIDQLYAKAGIAHRAWPSGMSAQRFSAKEHSRPVNPTIAA